MVRTKGELTGVFSQRSIEKSPLPKLMAGASGIEIRLLAPLNCRAPATQVAGVVLKPVPVLPITRSGKAGPASSRVHQPTICGGGVAQPGVWAAAAPARERITRTNAAGVTSRRIAARYEGFATTWRRNEQGMEI